MTTECLSQLERRASIHAALGDPVRLRIVDILTLSDSSSTELMTVLDIPSNLLAHHLKVLREVGLVSSHRSQGDGRKHYLRLTESPTDLQQPTVAVPDRVLFVCTANSARSHLAAALWRRASKIPAASAGTRPAQRIAQGAIDVAGRHSLPLPRLRPRTLAEVISPGDLVITVCDLAHEEKAVANDLHWSIPDPVSIGSHEAFDLAYDELELRTHTLAPRLAS